MNIEYYDNACNTFGVIGEEECKEQLEWEHAFWGQLAEVDHLNFMRFCSSSFMHA